MAALYKRAVVPGGRLASTLADMWRVLVILAAASAAQASEEWRPAVIDADLVKPVPANLPVDRIVGGEEAAPSQFPHQVGVWIYSSESQYVGSRLFCGGSVIDKNAVLTAAHCAQPGRRFELVFGAHRIKDEAQGIVKRTTTKKLVHEGYGDDGAYSNDIALLYFDEPLEFDDHIKPIRLPADAKNNYWNSPVTMSGWGHVHTSDSQVAPVLNFVRSRVVSDLYCRARFLFHGVHSTNICISGWWAKGTCQGDSGGPLVVYEADGLPTLVGVTSFGISLGCEVSWPSVFTRVTSYLGWVRAGVASMR